MRHSGEVTSMSCHMLLAMHSPPELSLTIAKTFKAARIEETRPTTNRGLDRDYDRVGCRRDPPFGSTAHLPKVRQPAIEHLGKY